MGTFVEHNANKTIDMEVAWDNQAYEDLANIYTFLSEINENAAEKYYYLIVSETRKLAKSPLVWPVFEETRHHKNPIRTVVTAKGRYKIFYRVEVEENVVLIVRIWDCRQDPCRLELDRWCGA